MRNANWIFFSLWHSTVKFNIRNYRKLDFYKIFSGVRRARKWKQEAQFTHHSGVVGYLWNRFDLSCLITFMNENEKAISHNIGKWHLLKSQDNRPKPARQRGVYESYRPHSEIVYSPIFVLNVAARRHHPSQHQTAQIRTETDNLTIIFPRFFLLLHHIRSISIFKLGNVEFIPRNVMQFNA